MKNIFKSLLLLLVMIGGALIALIEGTISLLTLSIINTHVGFKIGKWASKIIIVDTNK
jgi:hypothetical protein